VKIHSFFQVIFPRLGKNIWKNGTIGTETWKTTANAWKTTWKFQELELGNFLSIGIETWKKWSFPRLGTWDLEVF